MNLNINIWKLAVTIALLLMPSAVPMLAQRLDPGTEHSKNIKAVDEYLPAPGQFVNELPVATADDTPASMAAKCTAILRSNADKLDSGLPLDASGGNDDDYSSSYLISLGAYGGYITFHFDHSIANIPGRRDLLILGNSNQSLMTQLEGGASEPGIVMVSKDVNGNGLPDDPWYELAGSADVDSIGKVDYSYSVTYQPAAMQPIPWTDSQGRQGFVERLGFHKQEYYPLWISGSLQFSGTLLPPNAVDLSGVGTNWVRVFLRYGYADNRPNTDTDGNSFDLDWAVGADRKPVKLDFVDFVRVYTGVNQTCGWTGETSTEICHAEDMHLAESLQAISDAVAAIATVRQESAAATAVYDMHGRQLAAPRRGISIVRGSNGIAVKVIK